MSRSWSTAHCPLRHAKSAERSKKCAAHREAFIGMFCRFLCACSFFVCVAAGLLQKNEAITFSQIAEITFVLFFMNSTSLF